MRRFAVKIPSESGDEGWEDDDGDNGLEQASPDDEEAVVDSYRVRSSGQFKNGTPFDGTSDDSSRSTSSSSEEDVEVTVAESECGDAKESDADGEPGLQKKKVKKPKVVWSWQEMKRPGWWPQMLWQEKGSLLFFIVCFIALLLLGLLVDGWNSFTWRAWYSIVVTLGVFFVLVRLSWVDPAMVMVIATAVLLAAENITSKEAVEGFGNTTVITIAILFVIAKGIEQSGALIMAARFILHGASSTIASQARVMLPVALVSAFVNNTPVVSMMIPIIEDYCRSTDIPASKLMIPLSYASIFGGTVTMIGTSTNLIVLALVQTYDPDFSVGFFEIGMIGLPIVVMGISYVLATSRWLLPSRTSPFTDMNKHPSRYIISMLVIDKSPLDGKTIEAANLRHLKGVFLSEVERDGHAISAPGPEFVLSSGDLLLFAGDVHNVADLLRVKGLRVYGEEDFLIFGYSRVLMEAVVSGHSELVGSTVASSLFRDKYDAAIISIFRSGHPVAGKLGDTVLRAGDTLLMIGKIDNAERYTSDFVVVSQVGSTPVKLNPVKVVLAPLLATVMIILATVEVTDLLTSSLCCLVAMYCTRILTFQDIKNAINMPVLVTIAASFPLATALETWGVASELADNLLVITSFAGDYGLVFGVYLATCLLTALLSNASSAAIMVPIVVNIAASSAIPLKAYAITVMVAASADLSTPIGYQTNLMVWGPGGYKFLDYTKFGVPLQIVLAFTCSFLILIIFGDGEDADSSGLTDHDSLGV